MKKIIVILVFLLSAFAISSAAVPGQINFQGILKDASGHAITNPSLSILFSIYSGAAGGSLLWTETQAVTVEAGLYSVRLGSVNPIGPAVFDGTTRYLGIKAGTDNEMTPRLPLISVPYAYRAGVADSAIGGNADTVDGMHASSAPTPNYLYPLNPKGSFSLVSSECPVISGESSSTAVNAYAIIGHMTSNLSDSHSAGIYGINEGNGYGVYGNSATAPGVYGSSTTSAGIDGFSIYNAGVYGSSGSGPGVFGISNAGYAGYFYAGKGVRMSHTNEMLPTTTVTEEGTICYDTTLHKLKVYTASGWEKITSTP